MAKMNIKRNHIALSAPIFADFKNLRSELQPTLPAGVKITSDYVLLELIKNYRDKKRDANVENSV
jgi:hypothetical protein